MLGHPSSSRQLALSAVFSEPHRVTANASLERKTLPRALSVGYEPLVLNFNMEIIMTNQLRILRFLKRPGMGQQRVK